MAATPTQVAVNGAFDNVRSHEIRFLEEASRWGEVTVALWSDETVTALTGAPPRFPFAERAYFLEAVRFVKGVKPARVDAGQAGLPDLDGFHPHLWVDEVSAANQTRADWSRQRGLDYHVLPKDRLGGFPELPLPTAPPGRKKVIVTGCYDWFHSGHVRFFEEVSAYGDLYVIVGHDANIRFLKGEGHPLLPQDERRYVAGSIRYVTQALVSSGDGWLDAEPEIERLKPDIYAVNEDGDKGGKRDFCARHGLEYLVLKRLPAPGLPRRSSTDLRGF